MASQSIMERRRTPRASGLLVAACLLLGAAALFACMEPAFVGAPASRASAAGRQPLTVRRADEDDDGGLLSFLGAEKPTADASGSTVLSPEEYKIALDQEIEAERRKYYVNGDVKSGKLIVPWKDVDEKELEMEGRKRLRKNGFMDPMSKPEEERDSVVGAEIIGGQDVKLDWVSGTPGDRVGYIVERKSPTSSQGFEELSSYEVRQDLVVQSFAGSDYEFTDSFVPPGLWTYRILARTKTGDVEVVDTKEVEVPIVEKVDDTLILGATLVLLGGFIIGTFILYPQQN